jgi:thiamine-phosphate pyrophosphorylase
VDVEAAERAGWEVVELARAFFDGGARLVQIRAKRLPSGPFLALCDAIVALGASYNAAVIVNDRADLARLSGAAGVHVGQEDLPPADARAVVGPAAIVGLSTHDRVQIDAARLEPITYLAVGPVFGTRTKETGYRAVGVELVAEAVRAAGRRPVVAIGGITLENAAAVWAAGAAAVAVIGDLLTGGDPASRVASYNRLAYAPKPRPGAPP